MRPPYFPVHFSELQGDDPLPRRRSTTTSPIGNAKVKVRPVPHVGPTNGYRVDWDGASVAYISDHQAPARRSTRVSDAVLELCDGVDLLIHDAQYTPDEFEREGATGATAPSTTPCTSPRRRGAKRLALFHHDPSHDDDVDRRAPARRPAAPPPLRASRRSSPPTRAWSSTSELDRGA